MVGNKYNGDAIAIEFLRLMKTAKQNSPTVKKAQEVKPEDFLTSDAETPTDAGQSLDKGVAAMDALQSKADDAVSPAVAAGAAVNNGEDHEVEIDADKVKIESEDVDVSGEDDKEDEDEKEDEASDTSDLPISSSGLYILNGLGKIAGSLRAKNEHLAADMVEVTARSIHRDLVQEAVHQSDSLTSLEKAAAQFANSGDQYSADLLSVAIKQIKEAKKPNPFEAKTKAKDKKDKKDAKKDKKDVKKDDKKKSTKKSEKPGKDKK